MILLRSLLVLDLYLYDARKWKNKDLGNLPTEVEDYLLCHNKDIVSRIAYLLLYKLFSPYSSPLFGHYMS